MDEENLDINDVEIDKLQQAISNIAKQQEDDDGDMPLQNPLDLMSEIDANASENDATYKKYVLKIDKKYQPIIDKLTLEEREQYFNSMLEFYINNQEDISKKLKIRNSIIHILTVVVTCVIGLPLIFLVTNKSIELTVANYKQTQTNFVNLYRDKGGIKKKDLTKLRDLK